MNVQESIQVIEDSIVKVKKMITRITIEDSSNTCDNELKLLDLFNSTLEVLKSTDNNTDSFINPKKLQFVSTNSFKMEEFFVYTKNNPLFRDILSKFFVVLDSTVSKIDIPEGATSFSDNADIKAREYSKPDEVTWTTFGDSNKILYLSEDSGITIPVLDFSPGVISARISEEKVGREALASMRKAVTSVLEANDHPKRLRSEICDFCYQLLSIIDSEQKSVHNCLVIIYQLFNTLPKDIPSTSVFMTTSASLASDGIILAKGSGRIRGKIVKLFYGCDTIEEALVKRSYLISKFQKIQDSFGYNELFEIGNLNERKTLNEISLEDRVTFDHRSKAFNNTLVNYLESYLNQRKNYFAFYNQTNIFSKLEEVVA